MKTILRVLGAPIVIGLMMLVSLSPSANASSAAHKSLLPNSPLSSGLLMAQAIHSGAVRLPAHTVSSASINPNLTCSPAPCVLPNVQASGGNGSNIANEDPIATNPANKSNLLTGANDYNCASLQGFYASSNGGTSWTATCMDTLSGASGDGDPGVAFTTKGTAYRTGIDAGTADGYDIVYGKSTDGGKTWSPSAVAVRPLFSGGLTDKDWLWIDNSKTSTHLNNLYVSVTQFDSSQQNTEISVSHSSNGGSTWTTKGVDTEQIYPNIDQFSDITTGKDGTVYVTWMRCTANGSAGDCGGTTATFWVSKSTDGGNTWSTAVKIGSAHLVPDSCFCAFYGSLPNTSERVSNIPAVGIDNSTGTNAGHLYVVNYNYNGTNLRVQVTTSTNGGSTWGKAVAVAPKTAKNDEFFPWLSVSAKGTVGVTWLDRRNDASNLSYEAFAATASGGTGFASHNVQIASVASNPNNDGFGGGFMGDYTGNAWAGNTLYASWMDTRNGSNCQDEVGGYLK